MDDVKKSIINIFSAILTLSVLLLIAVGAIVTTTNSGMAVPDWPTTFGYNMFSFPFSRWIGGVFYEHSHRLVASAVGFMTIILFLLLLFKEKRTWIKLLGSFALLLVVFQGILGGLRVVWMKDQIGIIHAALAQAFLVLVGIIWLATSRYWASEKIDPTAYEDSQGKNASLLFLSLSFIVYIQLLLGAAMRHAHLGLSITDFPLAYGQVFPHITPEELLKINAKRETLGLPPTTIPQIYLQLAHRFTALIIFLLTVFSFFTLKKKEKSGFILFMARLLNLLVVLQITLGAFVIWTGKENLVTTAHVVVGALILLLSSLLTTSIYRRQWIIQAKQKELTIPFYPTAYSDHKNE
ncbi:COX15/CtaA family protein [Candidatus Methylacidiphilum infernorum]|uniref:COX15/CtaA family protein n=1 Tax=Candidatus Methylacidiphilum infernorum TaxID=511746 RepID=A0ABX7PW50_9BACT|nr:COX15/CtaA family protein [Candidatus Methylacidiphilum infernorum]QSR87055.1 COX15/CtaA family protein [Candidatus Methylacidiphilum infernorum]